MKKLLPLTMLVSSLACGDTHNNYYVNGGNGNIDPSGSSCEGDYQHIIDCDGLKYWSESKKEEFHNNFVSWCNQNKAELEPYLTCIEKECSPTMVATCDDSLEGKFGD